MCQFDIGLGFIHGVYSECVCLPAPVSEPAVSQTCLSPEQMGVSCSTEGDEVQFIFSLDDHLLMQTRTHIQSQQNWTVGTQSLTTDKQDKAHILIISLFGQLTGNLTCRVWNNVSRDEKVIHLKSCIQLKSCKGTVFSEYQLFTTISLFHSLAC